MKKTSNFILIILLFGFVNLNAQSVNIGIKTGVNSSTFVDSYTNEKQGIPDDEDRLLKFFTPKITFHFGIVSEFMLSNKFSIQSELLYSGQESDYENSSAVGSYKFDYLHLPILTKYYFTKGLSIEAGPQLGLLLSAKHEFNLRGSTAEEPIEEEGLKDRLEEIDFAVSFGIGYKLDSGFNFGARYNLGLTKFQDSSAGFGSDKFEYKSSVIQGYIGYFF